MQLASTVVKPNIQNSWLIARYFSVSSTCSRREAAEGSPWRKKVDFGTIALWNKRHLPESKKLLFKPFQAPTKYDSYIPKYTFGCRGTGVRHQGAWEHVPEKVPELVVPDLGGFKLKPYVSYRTKEIYQEPLTSRDLFNAVYGRKMLLDFKTGMLDENGNSLMPSPEEQLTKEDAILKARSTGSDIFVGGLPKSPLFKLEYDRK